MGQDNGTIKRKDNDISESVNVSYFQSEISVSKVFRNCNEKIVGISAQKSSVQIKQIKTFGNVKYLALY